MDKNLDHKNDIIHDNHHQHQLLNTRIKRLEVVHPDNLDPDEETLKELLLVTPKSNTNNINSVYDYDYEESNIPSIKEDIFPDRQGFFTGHRIPFELFSKETIQRLNVPRDPLVAPVSPRVVASLRGGVPRRPLPSHIKTVSFCPKKNLTVRGICLMKLSSLIASKTSYFHSSFRTTLDFKYLLDGYPGLC